MTDLLADWLNIALRLFHVVMGIAWIGSSLYFMWLDAEARRAGSRLAGVEGEVWMVHGGGFYWVQKFAVAPGHMPDELHWFKWEAGLTFLSGFALLCLIFFTAASSYLVDPAVAEITPVAAVAIALGTMLAAWMIYDALWMSQFAREHEGVMVLFSAALLAGLVYFYCSLFAGRGAFMMVGATLGMIMVANVWVRIIPGQRLIVAALIAGKKPEALHGIRGKQRSVHNNYMTFPVIFAMLSGHYPGTFAHPLNWLVLLGLFVVLGCINHWWNLTHKGKADPLPLVGAVVLSLPLFVLVAYPNAGEGAGGPPAAFAQVRNVINERCASCHATRPTQQGVSAPPKGVVFDEAQQIRRYAPQILAQSVRTGAMPPGNITRITREERDLLRRWIAQGAAVD